MDDKKKHISYNIYRDLIITVLLVSGSLFGIFYSNSMNMFYNFLIMPIVGALGIFIIKQKWYLIPIGIFLLSYIWIFVQSIYEGMLVDGLTINSFIGPLYISILYSGLTIVGMIIEVLLKFSFRREDNK